MNAMNPMIRQICEMGDFVRRMRVHRDFLSRWYVNVEYPHLVVVDQYFVSLRPSGHFHHVLRQSR